MNTTISIRPTGADYVGLNEMNQDCPDTNVGSYPGFYWELHNVALNGADWIKASKNMFKKEKDDIHVPEILKLTANKKDLETVVEQIRDQFKLQRVQMSYLVRLVIANSRSIDNKEEEVTININGLYLVQQITFLLQSTDDKDKNKIKQIIKIVEGDKDEEYLGI